MTSVTCGKAATILRLVNLKLYTLMLYDTLSQCPEDKDEACNYLHLLYMADALIQSSLLMIRPKRDSNQMTADISCHWWCH